MLKKEEKYFARFEKFEKTSFSDLDFDRNEAEKREKKRITNYHRSFHRHWSIFLSLETDYRRKIEDGYRGCKVVWKGRGRCIHFNWREKSRILRAFRRQRISAARYLPRLIREIHPTKVCQARFPSPLCFYISTWCKAEKGLAIKGDKTVIEPLRGEENCVWKGGRGKKNGEIRKEGSSRRFRGEMKLYAARPVNGAH